MHANQLTDDVLRSLSEVEADEPVVVSMFVNLDPSEFATAPARSTQFNSLLNDLSEQIREGDLSHDAQEALKTDRERIERFLNEEIDVSDAAAVAIYSAQALDFFQAIKLADAIESAVHVDLRPMLEPIIAHEDDGDWCVLLATRDSGRIFRGGPTGIREVRDVHSDVKNQHQQGGWSQARFERSVEQEVEWHLEAVTDLLFRMYKRRPFEHLIIGANNQNLRPALSSETHSYLLERLRGWIDIDEGLASEDDVFAAARVVMDDYLANEERMLLERFAAQRATDGRAVADLKGTLEALVEQRVETLLVNEGVDAEGTKCVTCGWIGTAGPVNCPVDETHLDRVDNIVEPAIQAAIQQSADVHVLSASGDSDSDSEAPFDGPLAAVLRY